MSSSQRYIDESLAAEQRAWLGELTRRLKYGDRVWLRYDEQMHKIECYTHEMDECEQDPVAWLLLELGDDDSSPKGIDYLVERLGRVLYYAECPVCDYFVRDCVCAGDERPLSVWEANNVALGLNRDGSSD